MAAKSHGAVNVFLVPLFNEEPNIPALAASLIAREVDGEKHYVLVDDGSVDGTSEAVRNHFKGTSFHLIEITTNHGPGYAFNSGFGWIVNRYQDGNLKVITLEGDNTSDLDILPSMLGAAGDTDLVLASVYVRGGGFSRPSRMRRVISNLANGLLREVFRLDVRTLTSFYRVYDGALLRKILERYGDFTAEAGFICKVELLLRARQCGARIKEIPVVLHSHKRIGKSKMKVFRTGLDYLGFMLRNAVRYRKGAG